MDIKKRREIVVNELVENGVPYEQAVVVSDCFVTADSYGVTSHGTAILPSHIQRIKANGYNLSPKIGRAHV